MWEVSVGPFPTKDEAEAWRNKHAKSQWFPSKVQKVNDSNAFVEEPRSDSNSPADGQKSK